jgi:hypothetical protein
MAFNPVPHEFAGDSEANGLRFNIAHFNRLQPTPKGSVAHFRAQAFLNCCPLCRVHARNPQVSRAQSPHNKKLFLKNQQGGDKK